MTMNSPAGKYAVTDVTPRSTTGETKIAPPTINCLYANSSVLVSSGKLSHKALITVNPEV